MRLLSADSNWKKVVREKPGLTDYESVRGRMQERRFNTYGDGVSHPISIVLSICMRMGKRSALKQHLKRTIHDRRRGMQAEDTKIY